MTNQISNKKELTSILQLLSESLAIRFPDRSWSFVVCGGSALNALELIERNTKDIDVIGEVKNDTLSSFVTDDGFLEIIIKIAKYKNLPKDWFNTGPQGFLHSGVPDGFYERLSWISYGRNLKIGYISRTDQIYFKLYASVDRGGYHTDDLLKLKPGRKEMMAACHWVLQQDVSLEFRGLLVSMLEQIGFANVGTKFK